MSKFILATSEYQPSFNEANHLDTAPSISCIQKTAYFVRCTSAGYFGGEQTPA